MSPVSRAYEKSRLGEKKPKVVELRIYVEYDLLVYYGAGSPSTKIVRSILSRKKYILSMSKNTTLAKIPPVVHKSAPLVPLASDFFRETSGMD